MHHAATDNNTTLRMHVVQEITCPFERLYKRFAAAGPKRKAPFDPSEPDCIVVGFKRGPWSYNFDED